MAQQVKIANVTYNDVPLIQCPDANGVMHQFLDTTGANATSSDILSGKTAFVNGSLVTGALNAGLHYETGTFTPTSNTATANIPFSNAHTVSPFIFIVFDSGNYSSTTKSDIAFVYFNWKAITGYSMEPASNGGSRVTGGYRFIYRDTSTSAFSTANSDITTDGYDPVQPTYVYLTPSSSRYWRSGRSYRWIAVWPPND